MSAMAAATTMIGVASSSSTSRMLCSGPSRATIRLRAGTSSMAAAGTETSVTASATITTRPTQERFERQSLPVEARTASRRARPMATKAEATKKTVPMKAAAAKSCSSAPFVARCPTAHGIARPGIAQRSRRSWIASSSSRDRCTSPRQKAMAASQPGPWRPRATSGSPARRAWRTPGSMTQPSVPAARASSGSPRASIDGVRKLPRRPHAIPAQAKTASSNGPSQAGWPVNAWSAA